MDRVPLSCSHYLNHRIKQAGDKTQLIVTDSKLPITSYRNMDNNVFILVHNGECNNIAVNILDLGGWSESVFIYLTIVLYNVTA